MGIDLEEDEAFPVFSMPAWYNVNGVFSAFSKTATPLVFENSQVLLDWEDITSASRQSGGKLAEFIADSNFRSSLIVGKAFGNDEIKAFLGLAVSYYQFGVQKNVLVPFARVEDFFQDSSDRYLRDPSTKNLEIAALHELLEKKKSNGSTPHPIFELSANHQQRLEDLEATQFQKLYQVLIRRSFLFSYG